MNVSDLRVIKVHEPKKKDNHYTSLLKGKEKSNIKEQWEYGIKGFKLKYIGLQSARILS